eukprot:scaffold99_cov422-Pavlova_lutheri.AAC.7
MGELVSQLAVPGYNHDGSLESPQFEDTPTPSGFESRKGSKGLGHPITEVCSGSGVSEGTGREKCGRLLLCWTREPTRRTEGHGNWNRWNTRTVKLGTWCLVIRTLVGGTVILGSELVVIIIDLSHAKPTEKDYSVNRASPPKRGSSSGSSSGFDPIPRIHC